MSGSEEANPRGRDWRWRGMPESSRTTWLVAAAAVAGGVLLALMLWFGLPQTIPGTVIVDAEGNRRGPDLLAHLAAARLVLAGDAAHLYDPRVQGAVQEAVLGTALDHVSPFLLPPVAAFLFVPFALLPYPVAATLWLIVSVALIGWSLRLLWPLSPLRGKIPSGFALPALVATYPVGMNLVGGNNAAVWLAIYALGARYLMTDRPVAAGLVLGFGALKPQLFLAVPVLLLAQRRWRALAAFAAIVALLAIISLALVGPAGARDYVTFLTSAEYRADVAVANTWRMLSLPAFIRGLGPDVPELLIVVVAVAGLIVLGWAVRRAPLATAYAAMVLTSVAIDPHCFLYDGMVLAVPILLLAGGPGWGTPGWALTALWLLTWAMLFRTVPAPGTIAAIPWVALPLLALTIAAWHDARDRGTPAAGAWGK